jgi:hypothetical protein
MVGAVGYTGYYTAGHCPDGWYGNNFVNGEYAEGVQQESCPNAAGTEGDYQLTKFLGANNLDEVFFWKHTYPHPTSYFAIAGGYYYGQPTLKNGLYQNERYENGGNPNFGTVSDLGSVPVPAGGDCPAGVMRGLKYTNITWPGDSGGPIHLYYGGGYYLAGTVSGSGLPMQWIGWIPIPANMHICTLVNPCN